MRDGDNLHPLAEQSVDNNLRESLQQVAAGAEQIGSPAAGRFAYLLYGSSQVPDEPVCDRGTLPRLPLTGFTGMGRRGFVFLTVVRRG